VAVPQWRVWTYRQAALVLGCSQRALQQRVAAKAKSLNVLLRESGGGAVLTGPWMVGVSVALPTNHPWLAQGLVDSYRTLGQLHADALAELGSRATALAPQQIAGMQADLATRGLPALDWACFGSLSPWEVVDAKGRKLVGLAQRRRQHGVLLVGGTLVTEPDWALLCDAVGHSTDVVILQQRTANCAQLPGRTPSPQAWAQALTTRLERALGYQIHRRGS
jgi:lipoate-protein ligase A